MSATVSNREALRQWLAGRAGTTVQEITDDYPLIEHRVIGSLQVMDLLLFIEARRGTPVDARRITPDALASINAICQTFFEEKPQS